MIKDGGLEWSDTPPIDVIEFWSKVGSQTYENQNNLDPKAESFPSMFLHRFYIALWWAWVSFWKPR